MKESKEFTHIDPSGELHMVDISHKPSTERIAVAKAEVIFPKEVFDKVQSGKVPKGEFLACARVAGIMSAKRCWELIPLCHPIGITKIDVDFKFQKETYSLEIKAVVKTTEKTGVEMEALTAVSVSALTIYDMCKALSKEIKISNIRLVYKKGGKSGELKFEEF